MALAFLVTCALAGLVAILLAYLLAKQFGLLWRPSKAPPLANEGLPLVGNLIGFASGPLKFIERNYAKHGAVFSVPIFHETLTFIIGPTVSAPFFQNLDDVFSQKEVYGFMKEVFGANVVYDAEPAKRKQQMQYMSRGLRADRLKSYVPKIVAETSQYLRETFKDGKDGCFECDVLNALSELTILTSSRCLHGDDVRETLFKEVSQLYHDLDKGITPISFFWPTAPLQSHRKRDLARVEMVKLFSKVIEARRNNKTTTTERTDILQVFVDMQYKDGTQASVDEITGLLIALLFAGQHTSSITSTWTALFLAANPKIFARCVEEQRAVCGDAPVEALTYEDLGKMELLHNCIKETLRMHPPLIMLMRKAMCDVKVKDEKTGQSYTIPKGDIAVTSPAVAGRLSYVFRDPDAFDPDRYASPREEHKQYPFAHLGFGGGIHQCMGQQFGYMQVKTILSVLLRTYSWTLKSPFPEPDYAAMVVGPKGHPMLSFKRLSA